MSLDTDGDVYNTSVGISEPLVVPPAPEDSAEVKGINSDSTPEVDNSINADITAVEATDSPVQEIHLTERNFRCHCTSKKLFAPNGLCFHLARKHEATLSFHCKVCVEDFALMKDFWNHLRAHAKQGILTPLVKRPRLKSRSKKSKTSTKSIESSVGNPPSPATPPPNDDDYFNDTADEPPEFRDSVPPVPPASHLHPAIPDNEDFKPKCGLCPLILTKREHAEAHAKSHNLRILAHPKCPTCSLQFRTVSQYFGHLCKPHPNLSIQNYNNVCFECNADFSSASARLKHGRRFPKHKLFSFTTLESSEDPGHALKIWTRQRIPADLPLTTPRIRLQPIDELQPHLRTRRTGSSVPGRVSDANQKVSQPRRSSRISRTAPPPKLDIFNAAPSSPESVDKDPLDLTDYFSSLNNNESAPEHDISDSESVQLYEPPPSPGYDSDTADPTRAVDTCSSPEVTILEPEIDPNGSARTTQSQQASDTAPSQSAGQLANRKRSPSPQDQPDSCKRFCYTSNPKPIPIIITEHLRPPGGSSTPPPPAEPTTTSGPSEPPAPLGDFFMSLPIPQAPPWYLLELKREREQEKRRPSRPKKPEVIPSKPKRKYRKKKDLEMIITKGTNLRTYKKTYPAVANCTAVAKPRKEKSVAKERAGQRKGLAPLNTVKVLITKKAAPARGAVALRIEGHVSASTAGRTKPTLRVDEDQVGDVTDLKFKCPECFAAYKTESGLARHYVLTHEVNFMCDHCGKWFPAFLGLTGHMREVHTERKAFYECEICGVAYMTRTLYARHKLSHPENEDILCRECGLPFLTKEKLEAHAEGHKARPPREKSKEKVVCELCGKLILSSSYKVHKQRHMGRLFKCDQCDKAYGSLPELRFHQNTHLGVLPYKCGFCSYRYANQNSIHYHMVSKHLGPEGFKEGDEAAEQEKPFICDQCGLGYTTATALKEHQLFHGERSFPCKDCSEKCYTRYHMYAHRFQDHKNPGGKEKSFECKHCGKIYTVRSDYTYHLRTHKEDFTFKCEVCGKGTHSRGNLNAHMRKHGGAYKCPTCGVRFLKIPDVLEHSKAEHGVEIDGNEWKRWRKTGKLKQALKNLGVKGDDDDDDDDDNAVRPVRPAGSAQFNAEAEVLEGLQSSIDICQDDFM